MNKFNKKISENIMTLGFTLLKYRKNNLIFYKHLENGLILTFGIEKSNLYKNKFTGSFYLSFTYTWSMFSPLFLPDYTYKRIGKLIPENADLWFNEDENGLNEFINKMKLAEKNMCKNSSLLYHTIIEQEKYMNYNEYLSLINVILEKIKNEKNITEILIQNIVTNTLEERNDPRNNKNGKDLVLNDVCNCFYSSPEKNIEIIRIGGNKFNRKRANGV